MHTLLIFLSLKHKEFSWINNIDTNKYYIYVYSTIDYSSEILSNEIIYEKIDMSTPVCETRVILRHIINNYEKIYDNLIFINSDCVNRKYIPEFSYKHIRSPFQNGKMNIENNCRPQDLLSRESGRKKFADWLLEFVDAEYFREFKINKTGRKNRFCIFFDEFVVPSAFIHSRSIEYYRNLLAKTADYEMEYNIKKSWYYIFNIHKNDKS
jgi:hypothetical protein